MSEPLDNLMDISNAFTSALVSENMLKILEMYGCI